MAQLAISNSGFVKTGVLNSKTSTPNGKCCQMHNIWHQMVPFFEAKYPGRDYVFECDPATAHYALHSLSPRGIGHTAHQQQDKTRPNGSQDGPRQLLGCN